MYIFGFREGWQFLFPTHPALAVDLITFAVILGIALKSAGFAFRIRYFILAVIAASLLSVFATAFTGDLPYEPRMWGDFQGFPEDGFQGTDFWFLFALFFPAATGIMAGANMSGELEDPRRAIPRGTLAAVAVGTVVYFVLAWWLARVATPEELVSNYTIMIDRAVWGPAVVAGLLGATFSSGLASLVGAPRILQALADGGVMPGGEKLAKRTPRGEPRNAVIATGVIVFFALLLRDLNTVAPLITMFFLITYAMINIVVFTEQTLGLISFRPLLRIPRIVFFLGAAGCLFTMFIIEPVFGIYMLLLQMTFIEQMSPGEGLPAAMQALDGAFFRPNCVFLRLPDEEDSAQEEEVRRVVRRARALRTGVLLFASHLEARLGRRHTINVWIRDQSPDWKVSMRLGNLDMSLLIGHILQEAMQGELNVISVVEDQDQVGPVREFLERVTDLARLPTARVIVRQGGLEDHLPRVRTADLEILGLAGDPNFKFGRRVLRITELPASSSGTRTRRTSWPELVSS